MDRRALNIFYAQEMLEREFNEAEVEEEELGGDGASLAAQREVEEAVFMSSYIPRSLHEVHGSGLNHLFFTFSLYPIAEFVFSLMKFCWKKTNSHNSSLVAVPDIRRKVLGVACLRFETFCVVFAYTAGAGPNVSSLRRSGYLMFKGGIIAELEM